MYVCMYVCMHICMYGFLTFQAYCMCGAYVVQLFQFVIFCSTYISFLVRVRIFIFCSSGAGGGGCAGSSISSCGYSMGC